MKGNEKINFLKQFETYLANAHPVDIKIEVLRPAIEQIIEDFEDSGQIATTDLDIQKITDSFCDQGYWMAILNLLDKA